MAGPGHRGGFRRSSGSRLKSARVEWLPISDHGLDLGGTFSLGVDDHKDLLYDFTGTSKYAENFGGGDWTVERMRGALSVLSLSGNVTGLFKICFGIGMVNGPTSVAGPVVAVDVAVPMIRPEVSWMVYVCCWVNLADQIAVQRCEWDVRSKRRISPDAGMFASMSISPVMIGSQEVEISYDNRVLIKQRGSRL